MRLVYIVDAFPHARAGTERQLSLLVKALSAAGLEVHVVVFRNSPWLFESAASLGVRAHLVPFSGIRKPADWSGIPRLWRLLRSLRPDLVHTFMPVANALGVMVARAAGVPTVVASRRDYGEWMTRGYLAATRFANRFVDHIVTNSHRVKELTVRKEGVPAEKISVIYNGMHVAAFESLPRDPEALRDLGVPESACVVGLVANFRPMKHHETALRAASMLADAPENFRMLFIGANAMPYDLREQMRAEAERLGVADVVHFVGDTANVNRYLGHFDIAINCSEGEGLSNAVMEYMAAGVPAVVADSGGNPDLIEHERTGLLFPVGDADALAHGIKRLARSRTLARTLADAARQRARDEFALESMVGKQRALYEELVC